MRTTILYSFSLIIFFCLVLKSSAENVETVKILPQKESFEDEQTIWINGSTNAVDWIRRSNGTPTSGTGPTGASDGNYYYYLEADGNYNQSGYLYSPKIDLTYTGCFLQFDFCMNGSASGVLGLELSFDDGINWYPMGAEVGNSGSGWITRITPEFHKNQSFSSVRFRFQGIIGNGSTSDIALDNIIIHACHSNMLGTPTTSENFIETRIPLTSSGSSSVCMTTISYFDGLGRLKQTNQLKASNDASKDIIVPVRYDQYGRKVKDYLPFAKLQEGAFYTNDIASSNWSYHGSEAQYALAGTKFDQSPLNRIVEQGSPGQDWQIGNGHTIKVEYHANTTNEVLNFDVDDITKSSNSYYAANQLYKTITKDANWTVSSGKLHTTEEFTDQLGLVVLKRSYVGSTSSPTKVDTYYVYDDSGLLRYVLSPKVFEIGTTTVTATELDQLCFQYQYDDRKRLIEKILPGADPVYMLYDDKNRLVMTRDGNMNNNGQWMYTLYDELNRPKETGVCSGGSFSSLQSTVNASSNYVPSGRIPYTYAYYDDYSVSSGWGYDYTEPSGFVKNDKADDVKGMITAQESRNLETGVWLREVFYYDKYGRIIQNYKKNHLGGYDRITNLYDFTGSVVRSEQYHKRLSSSSPIEIVQRYEYDHMKRLNKVFHKVGTQAEIILVENKYDELGQLIEKDIHNGLQSIDYRYNIRGWLTSINNSSLSNDGILNNDSGDLFGMELAYNNSLPGLSTTSDEQFNGNISAVKWKNTSHSNVQGYLFTYDALNRLKKADYKYESGSWVNSSNYDVYGSTLYANQIGYDLNGNIKSLYRNSSGGTVIDKLSYQYTGNQLKNVEDESGSNKGYEESAHQTVEYVFDDNGNLIDDDNRGHNIQYNMLNLPENINNGTLRYEYNVTGEKLRKVLNGTTTTDYIGNFVYNGSSLAYIITSEGRIVKSGSTYLYEYNVKDHLGNTRVSFQANGSTPVILQNQDYYPFGMAINLVQNDNRYLYNGKELQDDVINGDNLDWYDYGARMYDAQLGRWHCVDPKAEKYNPYSPYNYCLNNPINSIDPDGEDVYILFYSTSDSRFNDAARTREREIKESDKYDPEKDHVYMIGISDLGKVAGHVDKTVADAEENGYGKTVEAAFYTHGGSDGPTGDEITSGDHNLRDVTGNEMDRMQLSGEGWKSINWNFDSKNSVASFYGCQTAGFAQKFFDYSNVAVTAGQGGRVGPTYDLNNWDSAYFPSKNQNVYYADRIDGNIIGMFGYSRNGFGHDQYGRYRKETMIKGNVTTINGAPVSASLKVKD